MQPSLHDQSRRVREGDVCVLRNSAGRKILVFEQGCACSARIEHGTPVEVWFPDATIPRSGTFHHSSGEDTLLFSNEPDVVYSTQFFPLETRMIIQKRTPMVRAYNHEWSGRI